MGYIVDHETIKSWNIYKPMFYLKYGPDIGPLLDLNVGQYIKPLTNLKNAQGSPKSGLCSSAIAILRLYCRFKTDVKIIIYSRNLAGVSVTLCQRVKRFCTFDIASQRTKENAPAESLGCTPFLTLADQKIHCVFRPTFVVSKKIGANNAPKKLLHAIFACPSFANKTISAALKLSAKNGLRPSHESACDLSANRADKKERDHNSLPVLTRLLL